MDKDTRYQHPVVKEILAGLDKYVNVIHVLVGPRQTGKTTAARQIAGQWKGETVFAAADAPLPPGPSRNFWKSETVLLKTSFTASAIFSVIFMETAYEKAALRE